jgi:hypothetical protein
MILVLLRTLEPSANHLPQSTTYIYIYIYHHVISITAGIGGISGEGIRLTPSSHYQSLCLPSPPGDLAQGYVRLYIWWDMVLV